MCMLSGAITAIFYSSVVHLELSALSSFFTGNGAIEKLFIIIIIITNSLMKIRKEMCDSGR